jgi:hypothetical protein
VVSLFLEERRRECERRKRELLCLEETFGDLKGGKFLEAADG